jgi:hypothetical protein
VDAHTTGDTFSHQEDVEIAGCRESRPSGRLSRR